MFLSGNQFIKKCAIHGPDKQSIFPYFLPTYLAIYLLPTYYIWKKGQATVITSNRVSGSTVFHSPTDIFLFVGSVTAKLSLSSTMFFHLSRKFVPRVTRIVVSSFLGSFMVKEVKFDISIVLVKSQLFFQWLVDPRFDNWISK